MADWIGDDDAVLAAALLENTFCLREPWLPACWARGPWAVGPQVGNASEVELVAAPWPGESRFCAMVGVDWAEANGAG